MDSPLLENTDNIPAEPPGKRKRAKYIGKACSQCKRRKIKCNGQQPCQRCARQMIECVYADAESTSENRNIEKLVAQVESLQSQLNQLSGTIGQLGSALLSKRPQRVHRDPFLGSRSFADRNMALNQGSTFHGPTTSSFTFGLARQSLHDRGIVETEMGGNDGDITQEPSPVPSPTSSAQGYGSQWPFDPLLVIGKEEALRLCQVYEEEMGTMYPVIELVPTVNQVNALFDHLRQPPQPRASPGSGLNSLSLDDYDVDILKVVFACALTAESNGHSELGVALFNSVRDVVTNATLELPDIKIITLLILVSIFSFQIDEETLAWRVIGIVLRMCLEMGLHQQATYSQPPIVEIGVEKVLKLFWSAYTLDIRWSMGTGMPHHLSFQTIDPVLPRPVGKPYLNTMIDYCRIAEKVCEFVNSSGDHTLRMESMTYLDWQVLQWSKSIPESLRLTEMELMGNSPANYPNRGTWRLKALLYLRTNLLRTLIYRPILHAPLLISQAPSEATMVTNIAKDTIRFIHYMNESTDIYKLQQIAFNWFLTSAVAVLFLAVAHAPVQFKGSCKNEFYMALDLIKKFSAKSYVSKRLWNSIKGLRKLARQLGLWNQRQVPAQQEADPNNPIRGSQDDNHRQETLPGFNQLETSPLNGADLGQELMSWLEVVGDHGGFGNGQPLSNMDPLASPDNPIFGYVNEVASIMKSCF